MVELANGRPASGVIDVYPEPEQPRRLGLRPAEVEALLGKPYSQAEIADVLQRLDFGVTPTDGALEVEVPSHRRDVERRADLIEEIARVSGYDAIPEKLFEGRIPEPRVDRVRELQARARQALAAAGCQEIITYSLVHPHQAARLDPALPWPVRDEPPLDQVAVYNPMTVDQSVLRQTLLGNLLEALWSNLRYRDRVWLFELGTVFLPPFDPLPREPKRLAIGLVGPRRPADWTETQPATDFFDLKGVLEALGEALGARDLQYLPSTDPRFQPGRVAELRAPGPNGAPLGLLGQLHPLIAQRFDLGGRDVFLAELDFDALAAAASSGLVVQELPTQQELKLDLAIVVDDQVAYDRVYEELVQSGGPLLAEAALFDVYQGPPIPQGQRSLAFRLAFRAPDRTLTDEEATPLVAAIEQHLQSTLGARIRRG
jgi:phenylalanyl-tRNA synthetase beta chain